MSHFESLGVTVPGVTFELLLGHYCALRGFWCLNIANWVRYPSPFSERFPLGEHAKWRCDTPPPPRKRGISAILARYPMKKGKEGAIPPSEVRSRKGIARYGGVSRTGPLNLNSGAYSGSQFHLDNVFSRNQSKQGSSARRLNCFSLLLGSRLAAHLD